MEEDLDFEIENYNSFFYTSEKQIKKIDDNFILSKITEKYPDFLITKKDSVLKQAFILFLNDTRHIKYILEKFDISIMDLMSIVFRSYSFLFNTCFVNKIHDIIKNKSYVKSLPKRKS